MAAGMLGGAKVSRGQPVTVVPTQLQSALDVEVSPEIAAVGADVPIHVRVRDHGSHAPIFGTRVAVTVDGQPATYATADTSTDYDGTITPTFHVDSNHGTAPRRIVATTGAMAWAEGTCVYPASSPSASTCHYAPTTAEARLAVFKSAVRLEVAGSMNGGGGKLYWGGGLFRVTDGAGIQGRVVHCRIDGHPAGDTLTNTGDEAGYFTCPVATPPAGAHSMNMSATFDGDDVYLAGAAHASAAVVAPPRPLYAFVAPVLQILRAGDLFTARVYVGTASAHTPSAAPPGGPVAGVRVSFFASWVTSHDSGGAPIDSSAAVGQEVRTDAAGMAQVQARLPEVGNGARLSVSFPGLDSSRYDTFPVGQAILLVARAPTRTAIVSAPATRQIGQDEVVKLKVTRTTDGGPLVGVALSQGQIHFAPTDANGETTINLGTCRGLGTVSQFINWDGDPYTGPSHVEVTYRGVPATN
jgi:hypothetical protein